METNSASGDILVKEALGSVSAQGSAPATSRSAASSRTASTSAPPPANIRVGIKEGSRLFVDARSRSGDVTSELPVSDTPPEGDAPLVELRANTMSGDITIHRAGR